jgi:hypothetical protein
MPSLLVVCVASSISIVHTSSPRALAWAAPLIIPNSSESSSQAILRLSKTDHSCQLLRKLYEDVTHGCAINTSDEDPNQKFGRPSLDGQQRKLGRDTYSTQSPYETAQCV